MGRWVAVTGRLIARCRGPGIFALSWLALAHLRSRTPPAGRPWLVVAAGGGVLAGAVHLVLTPEQTTEGAAYGAFFLLAAVFGLLAAAAIAAGHARLVWRAPRL